jgi:hypothetical protein
MNGENRKEEKMFNTAPELQLSETGAGERSAPHGAVASAPAESNAPRLAEIPTKRELIDDALQTNANRSDREIAREIGVDHKTVGAARARLGLPSPLGNSPPVSPGKEMSRGEATDKAMAMIASLTKPPAPPEWDPFEPDSEVLVVPAQPAIAVYENTAGSITIRQPSSVSDEDDELVTVRAEHVEKLIARLRKVAAEMRE